MAGSKGKTLVLVFLEPRKMILLTHSLSNYFVNIITYFIVV